MKSQNHAQQEHIFCIPFIINISIKTANTVNANHNQKADENLPHTNSTDRQQVTLSCYGNNEVV